MRDPLHVLSLDWDAPAFAQALRPPHFRYQAGPTQADPAQAQVLLLRSQPIIDDAYLARAPHLRLVVRGGAGLDHLDQDALARRGIALQHTPGANAPSVGDHAVGMLLALLNRFPMAHHALQQGQWPRAQAMGTELASLTVGLLGYGHTGRAVAKRLAGFGCTVLAHDRHRRGYGDSFAQAVSLERLQHQADVLSLHIPLTDQTRNLVNDAFLHRFRKPIWLINLSRGGVANLPALAQALANGRLLGLGLDVFPDEPVANLHGADHAAFKLLTQHPNVLMTPHTAGLTTQSQARLAQVALRHVLAFAQAPNQPANAPTR